MRHKGGFGMGSYSELIFNYAKEGKIEPYEEELIVRLRNFYYEGIPLSIVLNSKRCCITYCHNMAFQLTRTMECFRLVRGNINIYPIDDKPNHSWVEKDGWVYDTTDGFKWEKSLYYKLFDATVIEEYDENNYIDCEFYQKQLEKCEIPPLEQTAMLIELIELLEIDDPGVNFDRLIGEITNFRNRKRIVKKFPEEVIKKFVLEKLEKQISL